MVGAYGTVEALVEREKEGGSGQMIGALAGGIEGGGGVGS